MALGPVTPMPRPFDLDLVEAIERRAIVAVLEARSLSGCSKRFQKRAGQYFPELVAAPARPEPARYFLEEVGRFLWDRWSADQTDESRDELALYACLIVYGRMASMAHWGAEHYCDMFQDLFLGVLKAIPKYDPARGCGVFGYLYQRVSWDILGANAKLVDFAVRHRDLGDHASEGRIPFGVEC